MTFSEFSEAQDKNTRTLNSKIFDLLEELADNFWGIVDRSDAPELEAVILDIDEFELDVR